MVEDTCKANSLVGTKIRLWTSLDFVLIFFRIGITNEAVFPVPFFARAIILFGSSFSFPIAIGITSSCTGDGFSKPFSYIPFNKSRSKP